MMRAEDIDKLTEEELLQKANIAFIVADRLNTSLGHHPERLRLQLEAQYYLTLVARKRDDKVSDRDFRMERLVIILISVEIFLSLVFGFLGLWEGSKQGKVLTHMDSSTAATAAAMIDAKTALKSLADEQKISSDRLTQMNENLQNSVSAARNQLHILKGEQADTLAQRSKKPMFSLEVPDSLSSTRALEGTAVIGRDTVITGVMRNETLIAGDFQLKNSGPVTAHSVQVQVTITSKAVTLTKYPSTANLDIREDTHEFNPALGPYDEPRHYTISLGDVRPKIPARLPLAFNFPKNHDGFGIKIDVSSEETSPPTRLWDVFVNNAQQ